MNALSLIYLIASVTFILGLNMLSHPKTAKRGNLVAAFGMTIAIFGTIFLYEVDGQRLGNYAWIFGGIVLGSVIGTIAAGKVKMTSMPEMVSLFNGMGGACAMLISVLEFQHVYEVHKHMTGARLYEIIPFDLFTIIGASMTIGSISFAGSVIAWGKLSGRVKDLSFKRQQVLNFIVLTIVIGTVLIAYTSGIYIGLICFYATLILALVYGVFFVLPIGGADMPVVISLLNSFTGVAAACGGFLYHNQVMLTGGILVGAAGTLLTILMCKAMNRSLTNVLLGSFGQKASGGIAQKGGSDIVIKEIGVEETAMLFDTVSSLIIVPGYGMAVAQAQHVVRELTDLLEKRGTTVKFAIHPVAGRMPGHMNVLLAEANIPYEKLVEMDDINDEFANTDVALIIGANDVVNPAARSNPDSPIYGMPILNADKARTVIVSKRSMGAGYAGIDNELFGYPNCLMLFGDAKATMTKVVSELKGM